MRKVNAIFGGGLSTFQITCPLPHHDGPLTPLTELPAHVIKKILQPQESDSLDEVSFFAAICFSVFLHFLHSFASWLWILHLRDNISHDNS